MTEVDFIMAMGITIAVISFIIFYSVGSFTDDVTSVRASELEFAKVSIADQLLKDYLVDDVKKVEMVFEDIENSSHTEELEVSLEPSDVTDSVVVYDDEFDEVSSSVSTTGSKVIIKFSQSFSAGEREHLNMLYKGDSTSKMTYESNVSDVNVTGTLLSEYDVDIISYEKCSDLLSVEFDDLKDELGIEHYFQLDLTDCEFGPNPPQTDVTVIRIPVLREDSTGDIIPDVAILKVWL